MYISVSSLLLFPSSHSSLFFLSLYYLLFIYSFSIGPVQYGPAVEGEGFVSSSSVLPLISPLVYNTASSKGKERETDRFIQITKIYICIYISQRQQLRREVTIYMYIYISSPAAADAATLIIYIYIYIATCTYHTYFLYPPSTYIC